MRDFFSVLQKINENGVLAVVGILISVVSIVLGILTIPCIWNFLKRIFYFEIRHWFNFVGKNESLIVITKFHVGCGGEDTESDIKIKRAIEETCTSLCVKNVKLLFIPITLPIDSNAADLIRQKYRATLLIQGEDTGVQQTIKFLNLKEGILFAVDNVKKSRLADPTGYAIFVAKELPKVSRFLAFSSLGIIYQKEQKFEQALELYNSSIKSLPENLEYLQGRELVWLNIGSISLELDKVEEALLAYNSGIASAKNNDIKALLYMSKAAVYIQKNEFDLAVEIYKTGIQATDDAQIKGMLLFLRGSAYSQLNKKIESKADFDLALNLLPENHKDRYKALCFRALILIDFGKDEDAFLDLKKSISIMPEEDFDTKARVYWGLAIIEGKKGNFTESLKLVSMAIDSLQVDGYGRSDMLSVRHLCLASLTGLNSVLLALDGGSSTVFCEIDIDNLVPPGMVSRVDVEFAVQDFSSDLGELIGLLRVNGNSDLKELVKNSEFSHQGFSLNISGSQKIQYRLFKPDQRAYLWIKGYEMSGFI